MDGKKDEKRRNGKNGKELVEMEEGKRDGLGAVPCSRLAANQEAKKNFLVTPPEDQIILTTTQYRAGA